MIELLVIILVLMPIVLFIKKKISVYDRLAELMEEIEESNKNLFGEYNARANLVLEIERVAKQGFDMEIKVLDKVLKARENAIKQQNLSDRIESEKELVKELGSMHTILVENYPTVTSTKLYQEVIQGFKDKAESIHAAIRCHNANIRAYNVLRKSFLGHMFAPISFPERIEYPPLEKLEEKKLTDLLPESYHRTPLPEGLEEEPDNDGGNQCQE